MTTPKKPPTPATINFVENHERAQAVHKEWETTQDVAAAKAIVEANEAKKNDGIDKVASEQDTGVTGEGTTLTPETVESVLEGIRDLSTFDPNVMNNFKNDSYHVRLFMTVDRDISQRYYNKGKVPATVKEYYDRLDQFAQITIAETGATTYNIESLQIDSLVGPNFQSTALNSNSMVMNVTEPNGVRFLDSMKNAALELQTRDIRRCWFYVELSFRGYDAQGNTSSNLLSNEGFENGGQLDMACADQ